MTTSPPLPRHVGDPLPVVARALIEAMQLQIATLQAEVRSLRERFDSNSPSSSQTPSTHPIHLKRQPPKTPRARSGADSPDTNEPPGPWCPPNNWPTPLPTCKPTACSGCGHDLDGSNPQPLRHPVAEIPPIRLVVVEYQVHRLICPGCGVTTRTPLPQGVPTGSFGPRLLALLSLLAGDFRLAKRPVPRLVKNFLGLNISLGMVAKLERQTAIVLEPIDAQLAEAVRTAPGCTSTRPPGQRPTPRHGWGSARAIR